MKKKIEQKVVTNDNIEESFEVEYMSRGRLLLRAFRRHNTGRISLVILIILYVVMLFADFFSPADPFVQQTDRAYAPPSEIHWKYEGKWVAPYIYDVVSYRDPVTYQRIYEPASVIEDIDFQDSEGVRHEYTLEKKGVTDISLVFRSEIIAVGTDRERVLRDSKEELERIPLSKTEVMKSAGISRVIIDPDELQKYKDDPIHSYKMNRI